MRLTLIPTLLATLAAIQVRSKATSGDYGLQARDYYDDDNSLLLERDDVRNDLLFERDTYYDDAVDNFLAHARDLGDLLEAREARPAAPELSSREVKEGSCSDPNCKGMIHNDPVKVMTTKCPICKVSHRWNGRRWVKA